jgi:hypothetical protein
MADLVTPFPSNPSFTSVNFKINSPGQTTESMSGKVRRAGLGVSFYTWEVKYTNLTPQDYGTVIGFVSRTLGQQYSFEIILPKISYTKAANQTSFIPQTSAAAAIGAISVTLSGCGAGKNVLAAGDLFKFANHSKVYMAVDNSVSNGSGVATLFFSGPLQYAVPSGTSLIITAVPLTAILAEDVQEFDVGVGGITSLGLQMREVW